uniref:Reverse transcriptase domain-containing protein n=1 Tax=Trichogramma kaykai TaxID=54128 RepID=A0ABD2W515_9HYME
MSRLKAPRTSPPTAPDFVRRAVSTLFPSVIPRLIGAPPVLEEHLIPEVGVEELRWAYRRVRIGAVPGPDGIPNTALKAAVEACFDCFRCVFMACLREGCFLARWKRQRLVLMLKSGKPATEPSSYRPLCMFDTADKILERIMFGRLEGPTLKGLLA